MEMMDLMRKISENPEYTEIRSEILLWYLAWQNFGWDNTEKLYKTLKDSGLFK